MTQQPMTSKLQFIVSAVGLGIVGQKLKANTKVRNRMAMPLMQSPNLLPRLNLPFGMGSGLSLRQKITTMATR